MSAPMPRPDAIVHATGRDDVPMRCAVWWRGTPRPGNRRLGYIGAWPVQAEGCGGRLLERACRRLVREGCTYVVGPINGSTWHSYRIAIGGPAAPFFPFEPPRVDPSPFESAGFTVWGQYRTTSAAIAADERPKLARGLRIRALDPDRIDDELGLLHGISTVAFRDAFLFHPIPRAEFDALYRPRLERLEPRCVRIAEQRGEPVGFLFAFPLGDDAVVLKSLAVRPDHRRKGVGRALMQEATSRAARQGRSRAIHALTHDANISRRFAGVSPPVLRRYVLFGAPAAARTRLNSAR